MSSSYDLDIVGTKRIVAAIIEQAYVDCGCSDEKERKEALQFFFSGAFRSIALALNLNDHRIRRLAGKEFSKAEQKQHEKDTRPHSHKKRKRQPSAQKYQLG